MSKIITSILTTLVTLAVVAQPWLLFPIAWCGIGALAVYLTDKYLIPEETAPPESWVMFSIMGPIGVCVLTWALWDKIKFQLPIKKND